jgi:5'-nucleotidase
MSDKRPLILVTNDDGVTSKGICALVEAVSEFGEIIVVAPDRPQSGMGHAVTIGRILRLKEVQFPIKTAKAYSTTGTPVDCVKLAIYEVLNGRVPDLLVSGINHGSNSSINVIYSGTMSAAVEGAVEGIPSIGFSLLDHDADADFEGSKATVRRVVKSALANGIPKGSCLNVNIPKVPADEIKGIKICRQAKAFWEEAFVKREDPSGEPYFWLTGEFNNRDKGQDTDEWALGNNFVSIVPVHYDMTAHHAIAVLNEWDLG